MREAKESAGNAAPEERLFDPVAHGKMGAGLCVKLEKMDECRKDGEGWTRECPRFGTGWML